MRQAVIFLVGILAIINAVIAAAPLLPNGIYRIYTGNRHVPSRNRYFTGTKNASTGSVVLSPNTTSSNQKWRLRNHGKQVSLELLSNKGYFLSLGKSGANPGAYAGVTTKRQYFGVTKFAGGEFTKYILSYPNKVNNKTLVLGETTDDVDPKRVAFQYENEPEETIQSWKFASVSA